MGRDVPDELRDYINGIQKEIDILRDLTSQADHDGESLIMPPEPNHVELETEEFTLQGTMPRVYQTTVTPILSVLPVYINAPSSSGNTPKAILEKLNALSRYQ